MSDFEKKNGGTEKVQEYLARISAGESKDAILEGLPEVFKTAIERELKKAEIKSETASVENSSVPPQYEGLPSFVLEEIWTIPIYTDPEKTKTEQQRKVLVLNKLRQEELARGVTEESLLSDSERIEEIKQEMGIGAEVELEKIETPYNKFSVANGETDTGVFWYQYRNKKAKELKETGQLEWGKERIYFDIKLADLERMRDLTMRVAGENSIAVAFKYLDEEKTLPIQKDGKETRFVANFASEDDAKKFLLALKNAPEYKSFISDRNLSHNGIRIDEIAEYASGFREGRAALERIMQGRISNDGTSYIYENESGKQNTLTLAEYEAFKAQYEKFSLDMKNKEAEWKKLF